jgi:hypothetical protein
MKVLYKYIYIYTYRIGVVYIDEGQMKVLIPLVIDSPVERGRGMSISMNA